MTEKLHLKVIVGPTAAGKTDYAIQIAQQTNGAVISADSRQLYAGMNSGTAKPQEAWNSNAHDIFTADLVNDIPHYLLNVRTPNNPMTLTEWQEAAFHIIDQSHNPLLVGGTMLYVDSIVFNYSVPNVSPNESLRAELETQSTNDLYAKLLTQDPAAKEFIEPHHKRRIIRALEVITATGQPFSSLRQKREPKYIIEIIGLFPGWKALEKNITERAEKMFMEGLFDETEQLRQKYGNELPLLQTMNYREAALVLDKKLDKKMALTEMVRANLRYARRQMSWWRKREDIHWITSHRAPV